MDAQAEVAEFYALLRYPGPDALITYLLAEPRRPLCAGKDRSPFSMPAAARAGTRPVCSIAIGKRADIAST